MQAVIFLGQERRAIEGWLGSKRYEFGLIQSEGRALGFNIRNVSSDGVVSVGIGGRVTFDSRGRVSGYSIERQLTGP